MMKKFSTFKERIREFIDFQGISIREFYKQTGISDGTFSNDSGLSEDNVMKFFSKYPNVNPEWFINGHGKMIKDVDQSELIAAEEKENYSEVNESLVDTPRNQLEEKERSIVFLVKSLNDKDELINAHKNEVKRLENELNAFKSSSDFSKKTH